MKKIFIILSLIGFLGAKSQNINQVADVISSGIGKDKVGYVNSEYILKKIPAYNTAQLYLDNLAKRWEKELDVLKAACDTMKASLEIDKILLSESLLIRRKETILKKEVDYRELRQKYFGVGGEYEKKQQLLMKPILNDIIQAIEELAEAGKYAAIQDISKETFLYINPKYNISDRVLKKMGYK